MNNRHHTQAPAKQRPAAMLTWKAVCLATVLAAAALGVGSAATAGAPIVTETVRVVDQPFSDVGIDCAQGTLH
jgi:hypothetical protein